MSTELSNFGKELKKMLDKITELVEVEIDDESKPKYPDGTPGYFGGYEFFGYLKNITKDKIKICVNSDLSEDCSFVRLYNVIEFTPLAEAILPMPVENTGTCPWKDGDEVRVEFNDGDVSTTRKSASDQWNWGFDAFRPIVRSWLIKRAGE